MVDQLLIKQKVEVLEVVTGIETANKYEVLNSMGQHVGESLMGDMIYLLINIRFMQPKRTQTVALECVLVLTGEPFCLLHTFLTYIVHIRSFDMNITDLMGQDVIHLYRPYRCSSCCCFCCLQVKPETIFISRQIILSSEKA